MREKVVRGPAPPKDCGRAILIGALLWGPPVGDLGPAEIRWRGSGPATHSRGGQILIFPNVKWGTFAKGCPV